MHKVGSFIITNGYSIKEVFAKCLCLYSVSFILSLLRAISKSRNLRGTFPF